MARSIQDGCYRIRDILKTPVEVEFSDPPPLSLTCCKCSMLSLTDMRSDTCEQQKHMFCEYCIRNEKKLNCPYNIPVTDDNLKEARHIINLLQSLTVFCIHKNKSCTFVGDLSELKSHLEDVCEYHKFVCHLCDKEVDRKQKVAHLNYCSSKIAFCEACKKKMPPDNFKIHKDRCFERTVECPNCSKTIRRKGLKEHMTRCNSWLCELCEEEVKGVSKENHLDNCPEMDVNCSICRYPVKRKHLKDHGEQCRGWFCDHCKTLINTESKEEHYHICSGFNAQCPTCLSFFPKGSFTDHLEFCRSVTKEPPENFDVNVNEIAAGSSESPIALGTCANCHGLTERLTHIQGQLRSILEVILLISKDIEAIKKERKGDDSDEPTIV